jgi:NAD+ kinase
MNVIGLIARPQKPEALTLAQGLKARFPQVEFLAEPHLGAPLGWPVSDPDTFRARAEAIVVLGGDGTLIHAARLMRGRAVPLLGVNLGSLGFMTEVPANEAFDAVAQLMAGRARVDSRLKLTCRLFREGRLLLEDEVLNDVVINKSALAKIADHETWLDGAFVATFKADGVIFATPTGSTAYSLSAGGPIVHPSVDCVIVTPICPHALTQRPIVVPGEQVLRVRLTSEVADVYLTLDGQAGHPLQKGDRIEVERAPTRALLVRNASLDYFAVLRQKLHWGER